MKRLGLVVVVLLGHAAADELGLRAPHVDVLVQDLGRGVGDGHGLGDGDLVVDVLAGLLVDRLELFLGADIPVQDLVLEAGDGVVGGPHALDLLAGPVGGAGIGHGVAAVSVGDIFEDERAVVAGGEVLAVLDGSLDGEDIHTVDLETGDILATLVVVGKGRRPSSGSTHSVLVV